MKKLLGILTMLAVLCLCGAALADLELNDVHFPDPDFREYLYMEHDLNHDYVFSDRELEDVRVVNVSNKQISSLEGIKLFTQLEYLECDSCLLTSLDISGLEHLISVSCKENQIVSLKVDGCRLLDRLDCYHNHLTSLDVTGCPILSTLDCGFNWMTSLNAKDCKSLRYLDFHLNELTSVDLTGCISIERLDAYRNSALASLDVSDCGGICALLRTQDCTLVEDGDISCHQFEDAFYRLRLDPGTALTAGAQISKPVYAELNAANFPDANFLAALKALDENGNGRLERLESKRSLQIANSQIASLQGLELLTNVNSLTCSGNKLTILDLKKNPALIYLACGNNGMTSLDVSSCSRLDTLSCSNNQLKKLDLSHNTALTSLSCADNPLTALDLSACTKLYAVDCFNCELTSLTVAGCSALHRLSCNNNALTALDVSACAELETLHCQVNKLTTLKVAGLTALKDLDTTMNYDLLEIDLRGCTVMNELLANSTRQSKWDGILYDSGSARLYIGGITGLRTDSGTIPPEVVPEDPITPPEEDPGTATIAGDLMYTLFSGKATVTGTSDKNVKALSIPATVTAQGETYKVTAIASGAFKGLKKLTKVTIGKHVSSIGKNAFNGCVKLKTVSGMAGVTTIGASAFQGCKVLAKITLPAKVKTIGAKAFYKCAKLKSITIKTTKLTTKTVGASAFKGVYKKAVVKVPAKKLKAYRTLLVKKGFPKTAKVKK